MTRYLEFLQPWVVLGKPAEASHIDDQSHLLGYLIELNHLAIDVLDGLASKNRHLEGRCGT
jgi:hypothetical protein